MINRIYIAQIPNYKSVYKTTPKNKCKNDCFQNNNVSFGSGLAGILKFFKREITPESLAELRQKAAQSIEENKNKILNAFSDIPTARELLSLNFEGKLSIVKSFCWDNPKLAKTKIIDFSKNSEITTDFLIRNKTELESIGLFEDDSTAQSIIQKIPEITANAQAPINTTFASLEHMPRTITVESQRKLLLKNIGGFYGYAGYLEILRNLDKELPHGATFFMEAKKDPSIKALQDLLNKLFLLTQEDKQRLIDIEAIKQVKYEMEKFK